MKYADIWSWEQIGWNILQISGNQFLLLATVLCHEFGHGNMARYLGGEIDHILLWVFGGICFSIRPQSDDSRKLLRDDLLVVAAGPATHLFQAPFWGLVLWMVFAGLVVGNPYAYYVPDTAWKAFVAALNPLGGLASEGQWKGYFFTSLFWSLSCSAVRLNVALFLFNVFFPMYPADGSKLLVTSLMFCCGLAPRRAANVLLCLSVPCALLIIGYSLYIVYAGLIGGGGTSGMLQGVMGFMGVMSLMEAYKINKLKEQRLLHTHPLFATARSWRRTDRDAFGVVHRINVSELDDDTPLFAGGAFGRCSIVGFCCPCFRPNRNFVGEGRTAGVVEASSSAAAAPSADLRAQRNALLDKAESEQSKRSKTVQQQIDDRAAQDTV